MIKFKNLLLSGFVFFIFLCSVSTAQNITTNPDPIEPLDNPPVQNEAVECGTIEITQSASQSIIPNNSVSCNAGGLHTDNSYYRAFDLSSFGIIGIFEICAVQIGVESASSLSGSQPITINLYTSNPAFPDGDLTQIGTTSIELPDQTLTIVTIPVTGTAPPGSQLVLEVFTPNGQGTVKSFFIGSNSQPQTGPSYLEAADCGVPTPVTTADIDEPNMHIVMNVIGDEIVERNVPTLSEWGLIAMAGILAIVGFMVIRRKKVTA